MSIYFFSRAYLKADANFSSRYVRLSFERRDELSLQTKRYWLVWDAATVGGLLGDGQRALVRNSRFPTYKRAFEVFVPSCIFFLKR